MLKIVGIENGKVADEKIILDENNKPTKFAFKLVLLEIIVDLCLFNIFYQISKVIKK